MPVRPAQRRERIIARMRRKQKAFQPGPGQLLQSAPLRDRHQNGGLLTAPGYDLRPVRQARVNELAEPRLGVLNLPCPGHGFPALIMLTIYMTSLNSGQAG